MEEYIIYPPTLENRTKIRDRIKYEFPSVGVSLLGNSILSNPIDMYRIGKGRRNILFVGAHHGSEYITSSVLFHFMISLFKSCENGVLFGVDLGAYLASFSLFVVPTLNPDGVEMSINGITPSPLYERQMKMSGNGDFRDWRANARGVDLNHNYEVGFSEYKKIEREKEISAGRTLFSGEYPESEPESRALANLVRSVDFSLVVSLHSQGEEIYYYPKRARVGRMASALSRYTGYSVSVPEGGAKYGGFCDYTGHLGIPSFTLEIGKGENPLPQSELVRCRASLSRGLFLLPTLL